MSAKIGIKKSQQSTDFSVLFLGLNCSKKCGENESYTVPNMAKIGQKKSKSESSFRAKSANFGEKLKNTGQIIAKVRVYNG